MRAALQNEFDERVATGEKSADVIKNMAGRLDRTPRNLHDIIKPHLRQSDRTVPTVDILQGDGSIATVNKSDFDPRVHRRVPAGPQRQKRSPSR